MKPSDIQLPGTVKMMTSHEDEDFRTFNGIKMMSSKAIARETGKRHKNVIRDIREMLNQLKDGSNLIHQDISHSYVDLKDERNYTSEIFLDRSLTLNLITGYRPDLRYRVIRRWMDLETGQAAPVIPQTPIEAAKRDFLALVEIGNIAKVPEHICFTEAAKAVDNRHHVPEVPLLIARSSVMDNIRDEDKMLEPTELVKELEDLGISSAIALNRLLAEAGLQKRLRKGWVPTEKGSSICIQHHWKSKHGTKSGYNLKWRVSAVREILTTLLQKKHSKN